MKIKSVLKVKQLLILLGLLGVIYSFVLPHFINLNQYKATFLKNFYQKTFFTLNLGNLDLQLPLNGLVILKTDFLRIQSKQHPDLLQGQDVSIKIKLLPLLSRQIVIDSISCSTLHIHLSVQNLQEVSTLLERLNIKEDPAQTFKVVVSHTDIDLKKYSLHFTNKELKTHNTSVIAGEHFQIQDFKPEKHITISAKGLINNTGHFFIQGVLPLHKNFIKKTSLQAECINFPIYALGEYLSLITKEDFSNAHGYINFKVKTKKKSLYYELKTIKQGIAFPCLNFNIRKFLVKGVIDLSSNKIIHKQGEIRLDPFLTLQLQGDDVIQTVRFNHLDFQKLFRYMPHIRRFALFYPAIKKFSITGQTSGSFSIKHYLTKKPLIHAGIIRLEDFSIAQKRLPPLISRGNAEIRLTPQEVRIVNSSFYGGTDSLLKLQGSMNLKDKSKSFIKISSNKLDVAWLKSITAMFIPHAALTLPDVHGSIQTTLNISDFLRQPIINGSILIHNILYRDKTKELTLRLHQGQAIMNETISIKDVEGNVNGNTFILDGTIQKQKLNIVAQFHHLILKDIYKIVSSQGAKELQDITLRNGTADGKITLLGTLKSPRLQALVTMKNLTIFHKPSGETFNLDTTYLHIINNVLHIPNTLIKTQYGTIKAEARLPNLFKNDIKPMIDLKFQDIDGSKIIETTLKDHKLHMTNPLNGHLQIKNNRIGGELIFANNTLSHQAIPIEVLHLNGKAILKNNKISFQDLRTNMGNAQIDITGNIDITHPLNPSFNVQMGGNINFKDLQALLPNFLNKEINKELPIQANWYGDRKSWNFNLTSNFASILSLANLETEDFTNKNVNLSIMTKTASTAEKIYKVFLSGFGGKIDIMTDIEQDHQGHLQLDSITLAFPKIYLHRWKEYFNMGDLDGILSGQIQVKDTLSLANLEGFIKIENGLFKNLDVKDFNGEFTAKNRILTGNILNINLKDSDFSSYFETAPMTTLPIELTKLTLFSKFADLRKFDDPPDSSISMLPFYTNNFALTFKKAYLGNIILDSIIGEGKILPEGIVNLHMLTAQTAGGGVNGLASLHLLKPQVFLDMEMEDIKANAAATALLGIRNELFGILKGQLLYETSGIGYDEMLRNLSGASTIIIQNGKFLRLGTMEHLLTATNILGSGITGLNLNSIIKSLIPMNTGNFQILSGDFKTNKGILEINSLKTIGDAINLNAHGSLELATNNANIQVEGSISRDVKGALGSLGNLSLSKIIDHIPGLGYIPFKREKKAGLIHYIPFVGYIPFFGRSGSGGKTRKFSVAIVGNLYDNKSVKNFHWIK